PSASIAGRCVPPNPQPQQTATAAVQDFAGDQTGCRFRGANHPRPGTGMNPAVLGSRYLLDERIGQGGMGVVWRGRDRETGAHYAIKVLRPEYAEDPASLGRFVRERTALLSLRHPNVVTVHDMVMEGSRLALVMDLVPGGDLAGYQRRQGGR